MAKQTATAQSSDRTLYRDVSLGANLLRDFEVIVWSIDGVGVPI